jgi:hypothetical protein
MPRSRDSKLRTWLVVVSAGIGAAVGGSLPAAAANWFINVDAPAAALEDFHRDFAAAVYPYPGHGAKPLGWVGFEVYVDASYSHEFDSFEGPFGAIGGNLPGGVLSVARIGVRKGLPLGFDLEATYGRALDSDLNMVSGTVQWALLDGSTLSPALSFRLTGSQSTGVSYYRLRQLGAEAVVSKGFAVLTPYVGAGLVRSESHFTFADGKDVSSTDPILFGGVTLNLLLPKINLEVQKGRGFQATLKLGFGL